MSKRIEGPFDNGAAYAIIEYHYASGALCASEEQAATGEAIEYSKDGVELQRVYLRFNAPAAPKPQSTQVTGGKPLAKIKQ